MKQVKLFSGKTLLQLEVAINAWLEHNQDTEIISVNIASAACRDTSQGSTLLPMSRYVFYVFFRSGKQQAASAASASDALALPGTALS